MKHLYHIRTKFVFVLPFLLMSFIPSARMMAATAITANPSPVLLYGDEELDAAKQDLMNMIYDCMAALEDSWQTLSEKATSDEAPELYQQVDEIAKYLDYVRYQLDQVTSMDGVQDLQVMMMDIRAQLEDLRDQIEQFEAANTFTAITVEGVEMTFKVISEEEKTCQVGEGSNNKRAVDNNVSGTLTIPEKANGYTVIAIGSSAFYECKNLINVVLPTGVTSIGDSSFSNCTGLQYIKFPEGLKSIGESSFNGCTSLVDIDFPASLMSLGYKAFAECSNLLNLSFPGPMTEIASYAFYKCIELKSVTLPNSVKKIGDYAFYWCVRLNYLNLPESLEIIGNHAIADCDLLEFTIPSSVITIGDYAFAGSDSNGSIDLIIPSSVRAIGRGAFHNCSSIKTVTVEPGNTRYDSRDGCNAIIETSTNTLIAGCISTKIPNSVTGIAPSAFRGYSTPKVIDIPNSVTTIGEWAFNACPTIESITISSSVTDIGQRAFGQSERIKSISVEPDNPRYDSRNGCNAIIETATNTLIAGCQNTAIPNTVTTIGAYAFELCLNLDSITIPNSVRTIERSAFERCFGLTFLEISESVASIGIAAFSDCRELTSVTIPSSVLSIGGYAYSGCSKLASVISYILHPFPIDNSTFSVYESATLYVPAGTKALYEATEGWNKFTNIMEMENNVIIDFADANVKTICVENWDTNGDGELSEAEAAAVTTLGSVFSENNDITMFNELSYFTGLTEIEDKSFYDCDNLREISFPTTITRIGNAAFFANRALKKINLPEGLTRIEHAAFGLCRSLTSLYIPKTVTYISNNGMAFRDCTGLTSITVDEQNQVYDSRNQCNAIIEKETLTLVNGCKTTMVPDGIAEIGEGAFYGQYDITELELPASVKTIGKGAYDGCGFDTLRIPNTVETIYFFAFWNCRYLTTVILPEKTPELGNELFLSNKLSSVYSYNKNPTAIIDDVFDVDWYGTMTTATLYVPAGCKSKYETTDGWKRFTNIVEMEPVDIEPINQGEVIDFADLSGVEVLPNLDGNIVGNLFFNILNDNGGYDSDDGCIVITESTPDESLAQIADKDFFDKELHETFTGIIFKVPAGTGNIKVTAQTMGNVLLKVKIGDAEPSEFELGVKKKVKIPYNVTEETLVYIYAGGDVNVKGVQSATSSSGALKIYSIESESIPTGITIISDSSDAVIYNLGGQRLTKPQKGINIVGGKKVVVK